MDKVKPTKEPAQIINNHWMESIQSIVDKTEYNLKGVGPKEERLKIPQATSSKLWEETYTPAWSWVDTKTLLRKQTIFAIFNLILENFKFSRRTERDKVNEIEQDLLFQKFHQEIIKNFNAIDKKLLLDSQKNQRDILNLRADLEDLRRTAKDLKTVNNNYLDRGELERDIENIKTQTDCKILEQETKQMRDITDLNEDLSKKINLLQDQISNCRLLIKCSGLTERYENERSVTSTTSPSASQHQASWEEAWRRPQANSIPRRQMRISTWSCC